MFVKVRGYDLPFSNNNGVKIHYEVYGEGPPLLLVHGLMGCQEDWINNLYVQELENEYKMVLVDLRGHGESDKPVEPEAYKLRPMTQDIVNVMNDLGLLKIHYLGFSLGGYVGLGLTKYAIDRLFSLTILDYGSYKPERLNRIKEEWKQYFNNKKEFMISRFLSIITEDTPQFYVDALKKWAELYRIVDVTPYKAWCLIKEEDHLSNTFPSVNIPCQFICAEKGAYREPAKVISEIIPRAEYYLIDNLTHADVWGRSDIVLPYVKKFLMKYS